MTPAPADARFEVEALPWIDDVARFARSLTRDEADADDVVQETFLRAYRSWHTFKPGTDCRRWLFAICRNVFLRERERAGRSDPLGEPELETLAAVQEQAERQAELEAAMARVDLAPAIARAIGELPETFRVAVVLVDVDGQSYDEAAEVLGVPIGTVRSRLFRGRRLLQRSLADHARDAGFITASTESKT